MLKVLVRASCCIVLAGIASDVTEARGRRSAGGVAPAFSARALDRARTDQKGETAETVVGSHRYSSDQTSASPAQVKAGGSRAADDEIGPVVCYAGCLPLPTHGTGPGWR